MTTPGLSVGMLSQRALRASPLCPHPKIHEPTRSARPSPAARLPPRGADEGRRPATGTGQSVLRVDAKREDIKINTKQLA